MATSNGAQGASQRDRVVQKTAVKCCDGGRRKVLSQPGFDPTCLRSFRHNHQRAIAVARVNSRLTRGFHRVMVLAWLMLAQELQFFAAENSSAL